MSGPRAGTWRPETPRCPVQSQALCTPGSCWSFDFFWPCPVGAPVLPFTGLGLCPELLRSPSGASGSPPTSSHVTGPFKPLKPLMRPLLRAAL